jgi:hypothetical protein
MVRDRLMADALAMAVALTLAGPSIVLAQPPAGELIVNGDAEADPGASSNSEVVKPTGWNTTGDFTAVQYGASGGFPDANSPGPQDRGNNFFAGGNTALSTATQTIDLSPFAGQVAAGHTHYDLSGWLGGFERQADAASVRLQFRDAAGALLPGIALLGPVGPDMRHGATGLVRREADGLVPPRARSAEVTIVITRREGNYNDGSVDNLSLVLK